MAQNSVGDPFSALSEARLERLARLAAGLLAGRPLHFGGQLPNIRTADGGLEFLEHRNLSPGDDPRHIDWRASARSRRPLVRRYHDERAGDWLVCLDRSASMGASDGVWPLALRLTAAFAYLLSSLDHRVGLMLFSTRVDRVLPPGRGRSGHLALRRLLRDTTPRESGGGSRLESCLPRIGRGRQVVVVSDFLTPDAMTDALSRIALHCDSVHVLQVAGGLPMQTTSGDLTLEDVESGERIQVRGDPALGQPAAERRRSLTLDLERHCKRHRIRYSLCPLDSPWDLILLGHLLGPEARLA